MTNLSVFTFEQHQVRFVGTAENPEWVAQDICDVLEIASAKDQLKRFEVDEKGVANCPTPGGNQEMLTVTEPGLYRLIFKSRKAVAKKFQRWLFHEVIPNIRKTGSYSLDQQPLIPPFQAVKEKLETIRLGLDLFDELGGCDQRTQILLKDQIRNILLADQLKPLPSSVLDPQGNTRLEYPVSDRARELGFRPNSRQLQQIGKEASRLYLERHGCKPIQREQFVGGATRMVNVYSQSDVELLDEAILSVMSQSSK